MQVAAHTVSQKEYYFFLAFAFWKGRVILNRIEQAICKATIYYIKEITGKGPKNIHAKLIDDVLGVHFWLQKNPIEHFVHNQTEKGDCILRALYSNAIQHRIKNLESDFENLLEKEIKFNDLKIDLDSDKYIVLFKIKQIEKG